MKPMMLRREQICNQAVAIMRPQNIATSGRFNFIFA
jgi:hypothetical protein